MRPLGCVARVDDGFVVGFFDAALCEPREVRAAPVGPLLAADNPPEVFALELVERIFEFIGE